MQQDDPQFRASQRAYAASFRRRMEQAEEAPQIPAASRRAMYADRQRLTPAVAATVNHAPGARSSTIVNGGGTLNVNVVKT